MELLYELLMTAAGKDLDDIGNPSVGRRNKGESDQDYRGRIEEYIWGWPKQKRSADH